MKAVITGTPLEIEGEAAEIAQLVELLSTGAVMVEHQHRWRVPSASDGAGVYLATCWCGQERTFTPFEAMEGKKPQISLVKGQEPIATVNTVALSRSSGREPKACCGSMGARHKRGCSEVAA